MTGITPELQSVIDRSATALGGKGSAAYNNLINTFNLSPILVTQYTTSIKQGLVKGFDLNALV